MTRDERQLLASVLRFLRERSPYRQQPYDIDDLTRASFDEDEITVERRESTDNAWPFWGTKYRFRTVVEGVDLAVALGLLPAEFSSTYAEGYEAARDEYQVDDERVDDVVALFRITASRAEYEPYLECRRCEDHVASLEDHGGTPMASLLDAMRDHFETYHAHEIGDPT